MLTREDDVDACALHRQGWTISAIARHLGHDRKTIRPTSRAGEPPGRGPGQPATASARSSTTPQPGWPRTRTCGPARCSTNCSGWGSPGPIRR